MTTLAWLMIIALAFKLGMWFERRASGRLADMEQAYNAGYDEGREA